MSERNDETIKPIREVRRRISAQFGHDPKRLIEHYMELQKQHHVRLLPQSTHGEWQE